MTTLTLKKAYQEDVSTLAAGTELIAYPCIVYSITISKEADGDAVVSFSDSASAYDTDERCAKLVTTGEQHTEHIAYPRGLTLDSGLCATSNLASVDVTITYE